MPAKRTYTQPVRASLSNVQIAVTSVLFALLTPHGMALAGVPDDSAVYTYMGWSMKHGRVPYVDVWDHKGPLLYELQRLGAMLPHPGTGMMLLDGVATLFSIAVLLWVASRLLGPRASIALTVAAGFFCCLTSNGGNMTETWAVPFLAVAQLCAFEASRKRLHVWLTPLTGAAMAAIFWLRPNMCVFAGLAALYILWEFFRERGIKDVAVQVAGGVAGIAVVTVAALGRVMMHGAMPAMKAAYFGYNVAYSKFVTTGERIHAVSVFAFLLYPDALTMLAIASWVLIAVTLLAPRTASTTVPRTYRALLLVSAAIEIAAISLSGRAYLHYLYTLLPTLFVLCAVALHVIGRFAPADDSAEGRAVLPYRRLVWLLLLIMLPQRFNTWKAVMKGQRVNAPVQAMTKLVDRVTGPQDRIALLGGPEVAYVYLHGERFATSRYFYTLPIVHDALPQGEAVRAEYVQRLIAAQPKIIASDPAAETGTLCSTEDECAALNKGKDAEGYDTAVLPRLLQPTIAAAYVRYEAPEIGKWRVYLRHDVAAQINK